MCNPNSSVANRRYRHAALQSAAMSSSASLLTQKLMGSMITSSTANSSHQGATFVAHPNQVEADNAYDLSFPSYERHRQPQPHHYNLQYQHPAEVKLEPTKAKRRRKPQKPGLTAKNQERHFVQHHYNDHANDPDDDDSDNECRRRGGVAVSFPLKLHSVLEQVEADGFAHVISWSPHGRCFVIHKPKEFTDVVMPRYFRQTKLTSFQRQLNLYGFARLTRGDDNGGYYHELFLRGKEYLCKRMVRTKVKGTKFKAASSPEQEPDFFSMPPVTVTVVTPNGSEGDNSEDDSQGTTAPSMANTSSRSLMSYQESAFAHSGHFDPPRSNHGQAPSTDLLVTQYHPHEQRSRHLVDTFYLSGAYVSQPQEAPVSPMPAHYATLDSCGSFSSALGSAPRLPMTFSSASAQPPSSMPSASNEGFFDEAVEDLFLEDTQAVHDVMEFVQAWDPSSLLEHSAVNDDIQLGNLLDKLLED